MRQNAILIDARHGAHHAGPGHRKIGVPSSENPLTSFAHQRPDSPQNQKLRPTTQESETAPPRRCSQNHCSGRRVSPHLMHPVIGHLPRESIRQKIKLCTRFGHAQHFLGHPRFKIGLNARNQRIRTKSKSQGRASRHKRRKPFIQFFFFATIVPTCTAWRQASPYAFPLRTS